jgi:hypothetical protein
MKLKESFKVSVLGYLMIIVSALIIQLIIKLESGFYPSFFEFTMLLLTFRLWVVNRLFILGPLLTTSISLVILSKTSVDKRIAGGISLSSFYILAAVTFYLEGAAEFSYAMLGFWIIWVFVLGFVSIRLKDILGW